CQIIYKELNREVFNEKGNKLIAFPDRPRYWEAWDIPLEYENYGKELKEVESIEIIEKGPFRGKIKIVKKYKSSLIDQYYTLYAYSQKIEVINEIKWYERRTMLRAYFPLNLNTPFAYYEVPYGIYWKPTHKNTSWEKAQFEIPVHRFIDLSQRDFGVSILNNGKYGHSINENTVGITLLRSPITPDYSADLGEHNFSYAILPHKDSLKELTLKESEELNRPLYTIKLSQKVSEKSLLSWENTNVILGSLKRAENDNGIILRFVEYLGREDMVKIHFNIPIKKAFETNLLEDIEREIPVRDSTIEINIKPFEIKTIKLLYR
ncbi:MAG: glycoside hydrolase family 38 C-terminal domain-containing protein, partial [Dictyoglomus sp.]